MTIQSAANAWLHTLETRKRKPAKPATLKTFESFIRAHIVPSIGGQQIEGFGNAQLREFVAHLDEKELSPKTINESDEMNAVLYLLLASSGLRVGEALALKSEPSDSSTCFVDGAVIVRKSVWRRTEQLPKTAAAIRTIELAAPVAKRIADFMRGRSGFVFGNGLPPSEN